MKLKTYSTLHKIAAADYMDQAMNNHRQAAYMADSRRDRSEATNRQTPATWYPQWRFLDPSRDYATPKISNTPQYSAQPQVTAPAQPVQQQQTQSGGSGFLGNLSWLAAGALGGWIGSKYFGGPSKNNQQQSGDNKLGSKATAQDIQTYNRDTIELDSDNGHVIQNPKTSRREYRMSRRQLMDFYNKNKNGAPYKKYKSAEEFADAAEREYAHRYAQSQSQMNQQSAASK
jgi:hypothetical protein